MALTNPPDIYQAQDFVSKFVGLTAYENKQVLINLLRKNGVSVEDSASPNDVIVMTYLAIAQSPQFKADIISYLKSVYNGDTLGADSKKEARQQRIAEQGGTKVGNLLRSLGTEENIGALLNTGLSFVSQKMTAKADQKSINAAAQQQAAKAQAELAEAAKIDAQANKNKWILPVALAAIIIAGVITYIVIKRKK